MSDPPPARRTVNLTQAGYISLHLYRRIFSPQVARKQKIPPKKNFYWKNEAPFKAGRRGSNMKNVRHGERVSRHGSAETDRSAVRRQTPVRRRLPSRVCLTRPAQASRKSPIRSIGKRKLPQRRQCAGGEKILDNARNL